MAVRATQVLTNTTIKTYLSKAATDMTAGRGVKFDATDTTVTNAGAGDDAVFCGVALETVAGGSARVQVAIPPGGPVPMIVGTGGVTRGVRVKLVADGVADAATNENAIGWAAQSGVVGDLVGINIARDAV